MDSAAAREVSTTRVAQWNCGCLINVSWPRSVFRLRTKLSQELVVTWVLDLNCSVGHEPKRLLVRVKRNSRQDTGANHVAPASGKSPCSRIVGLHALFQLLDCCIRAQGKHVTFRILQDVFV